MKKTTKVRGVDVSVGFVALLFLLNISSSTANEIGSTESSASRFQVTDALDNNDALLPIVKMHLDEITASSIEELVSTATNIVIGEVSSVDSGARFYHSGNEDPDRSWYEQVRVNFKVISNLKGHEISPQILWTAYEVKVVGRKATRVKRVEVADLMLNRSNIGDRYVLFLEPGADGQLQRMGSINGVQPLDKEGRLIGRGRRSEIAASTTRSAKSSVADSRLNVARDRTLFRQSVGQEISQLLGL